MRTKYNPSKYTNEFFTSDSIPSSSSNIDKEEGSLKELSNVNSQEMEERYEEFGLESNEARRPSCSLFKDTNEVFAPNSSPSSSKKEDILHKLLKCNKEEESTGLYEQEILRLNTKIELLRKKELTNRSKALSELDYSSTVLKCQGHLVSKRNKALEALRGLSTSQKIATLQASEDKQICKYTKQRSSLQERTGPILARINNLDKLHKDALVRLKEVLQLKERETLILKKLVEYEAPFLQEYLLRYLAITSARKAIDKEEGDFLKELSNINSEELEVGCEEVEISYE